MADIILKDTHGKDHTFTDVDYLTIPKVGGGTVRAKIVGESNHLDITEQGTSVDCTGFESVSATYPKLTDEVDLLDSLIGTIVDKDTED